MDNNIMSAGTIQENTKLNYSGVPGQALDAIRMRLSQLLHSLKRIRDEFAKPGTQQWYTLQSQLNVTLSQLMSATSTLQHFQDTLDTTVVYPLPKFPTTSHESLLTTLLRKKNIPEVDDWLAMAKEVSGLNPELQNDEEINEILKNDKEVTKWVLTSLVEEFEKYDFKRLYNGPGVDSSTTPKYAKPKQPFDINGIMDYLYKGKLPERESTTPETSL
ncbi:hypothetical protein TPHA_0L01740 [Tetrapisispora phaffii CBS 4417]|uniref:Mediator of RNA polymerase II transcription subunit 8 n=1 Tax=Tetrapisispora phaffii (strain ATCC 24235 / CBS 4417 / NBRC 1672 / NRRL Y-8282 / UCD 70-5) TaxID=1071381 RepID=G8C049_TETPH|nr:hypothetical protein TPHA_0L01740 [Tetrapisispora phaffii CBS 4417]CCE65527.1 hypothetical protein TPHA_0L01740 [Tetrapisispora phaffii CBS 4417]